MHPCSQTNICDAVTLTQVDRIKLTTSIHQCWYAVVSEATTVTKPDRQSTTPMRQLRQYLWCYRTIDIDRLADDIHAPVLLLRHPWCLHVNHDWSTQTTTSMITQLSLLCYIDWWRRDRTSWRTVSPKTRSIRSSASSIDPLLLAGFSLLSLPFYLLTSLRCPSKSTMSLYSLCHQ
jgi:hypothetical protein